jgi:hypothetical protein
VIHNDPFFLFLHGGAIRRNLFNTINFNRARHPFLHPGLQARNSVVRKCPTPKLLDNFVIRGKFIGTLSLLILLLEPMLRGLPKLFRILIILSSTFPYWPIFLTKINLLRDGWNAMHPLSSRVANFLIVTCFHPLVSPLPFTLTCFGSPIFSFISALEDMPLSIRERHQVLFYYRVNISPSMLPPIHQVLRSNAIASYKSCVACLIEQHAMFSVKNRHLDLWKIHHDIPPLSCFFLFLFYLLQIPYLIL